MAFQLPGLKRTGFLAIRNSKVEGSGIKLKKGYSSKAEQAGDAFALLNDFMKEVAAARIIYLFASERFYSKFKELEKLVPEGTRIFIRRAAVGSLASVLYRFQELYEEFLKPLGCNTVRARALYSEVSNRLGTLRQIHHHVTNRKTGRYFSVEEMDSAFQKFNERFPDIFERKDDSGLIGLLQEVRDRIKEKYPGSEQSVAIRHQAALRLEEQQNR